jgi:hypothetical protein
MLVSYELCACIIVNEITLLTKMPAGAAAGNDTRTVLTKEIFGELQRKQFFARYKLHKLQKAFP